MWAVVGTVRISVYNQPTKFMSVPNEYFYIKADRGDTFGFSMKNAAGATSRVIYFK